MTTIAIPLSDERVTQLRQRAQQAGLAPEEFLRQRVEQILVDLLRQIRDIDLHPCLLGQRQ